jgi:hypothetical protein
VSKAPEYRIWRYTCGSCGYRPKGFESRVPVGQDPNKCGPVECGKCSGRRFAAELVEEKKCA